MKGVGHLGLWGAGAGACAVVWAATSSSTGTHLCRAWGKGKGRWGTACSSAREACSLCWRCMLRRAAWHASRAARCARDPRRCAMACGLRGGGRSGSRGCVSGEGKPSPRLAAAGALEVCEPPVRGTFELLLCCLLALVAPRRSWRLGPVVAGTVEVDGVAARGRGTRALPDTPGLSRSCGGTVTLGTAKVRSGSEAGAR